MSARAHAPGPPERTSEHRLRATRPILGRDGEIALGRRMEEAEQRILEAIRARDPSFLEDRPRQEEESLRAHVRRMARAFLATCNDEVVSSAVAELDAACALFVESNLRLVIAIARRREFQDRGVLESDLVQEGTFGLMRAVEAFDYRLGYKFSTYATWWVRQFVQRAIAEQSHSIRLPLGVAELLHKVRRARREHLARDGREPTHAELIGMLGVTRERLEAVLDAERAQPKTLHRPIGHEGDGELLELLQDEDAPMPDAIAEERSLARVAQGALDVLTPRERLIVTLRFGFGDDRDHTLQEIGARLGLTRERVRQLEARALEKLKGRLLPLVRSTR